MPRIDPQQLLKCLSVLLSPMGGIKSKDEVQRLASLMTKFSKKLVSKCIYVSILKTTETDLLVMFMSAGGWDLTYSWLSDGVAAKNWPLVTELVDLLLLCPVDIDRLKTNACPKLIKTLSKDISADENVRLLACKLVEQWLRVVRGDNDFSIAKQPTIPVQATTTGVSTSPPDAEEQSNSDVQERPSDISGSEVKSNCVQGTSDSHLPVYKIIIRDGKKVLAEVSGDRRSSTEAAEEEGSTGTEEINQDEEDEHIEDEVEEEELIKPVKINKRASATKLKKQVKKPAKVHNSTKKERESTDSGSSSGKSPNRQKDAIKVTTRKVKSEQAKVKAAPKSKSSPKQKEIGVKKDSSVNKEQDEVNASKPKEKLSLSLKTKKNFNSVKEKDKSDQNKQEINDKNKLDDGVTLTDKEKESLSKFITPPISKVGKIPKKSSLNKEEKQSEEKCRALKDESSESKTEFKKSIEVKKAEIKRPEKKYSISVEPKRSFQNDSRPKTVKTYNSKFRSTGLEEEIKPPLPRVAPKKPSPAPFPPVSGLPDKKPGKRSSPPSTPEPVIPEKKPKSEVSQDDKKLVEKAGGIKLIPAKPKPAFLQESDVFMDAMLAANTMKEPRKRKRRASIGKDSGPSDPKKESSGGNNSNSPSNSPKADDMSPSSIKPTFKFYQDTLDTSTEEEKSDSKMDDDSGSGDMDHNPDDGGDDQKSLSSEEDRPSVKVMGPNGPLKGVLMHLKSKRQKKTVSWKEDGLESIKYFDLDETERVNVTKNFTDAKNMEREHERENFQIARKLVVDDIMEERVRWKALIPIDIAAPVVAPGKNSQEKDIQYAREKTVAAAHYFNKRVCPDSAEEPDLEIHATTDPACIPLDDITGSTESVNDFTSTPWPEPRGQPPAPAPPAPPAQQPPPPPQQQPPPPQQPAFQPVAAPFPQAGFPPMGPFIPSMPMPAAGDCWRSGDGKVVPMQPEMFAPQGMMPAGMPAMGPGPMMIPPGVNAEMAFPMGMPGPGPNPSPEEMAHFGGGFPPMGPSPPQMFGPPPPPPPQGPQSGNFQNPSGGSWQGAGGGNWYQGGHNDDQPPPHHNQGGSGRYQGGNWRGGGGRSGGSRNPDGWGGGGNSRTPICNNFIKRGFCRNNNCRFRHPR